MNDPAVDSARVTAQRARATLFALTGALLMFGLFFVLDSSSVTAQRLYGSPFTYFYRQVVWVGVGVIAMLISSRVPYGMWRPFVGPVSLVVWLMLLATDVIGRTVNGSQRWIGTSFVSFQPSELAKLCLVLLLAAVLTRTHRLVDQPTRMLGPAAAIIVAAGVPIVVHDLGTALVVGGIGLVMLLVTGIPARYLGRASALGLFGVVLAVAIEPYRLERVRSFLDPWRRARTTGYQATQGLIALASGQLTGLGLGASKAKYGYLPAAHTDFIFAIIGEETGLIGAVVVLLMFGAIVWCGLTIARTAPDAFGFFVAIGISAWIGMQALINVGAVVGVFPITGVPLPLVSYGGSSMVVIMAALGLLLNIASAGAGAVPYVTGATMGAVVEHAQTRISATVRAQNARRAGEAAAVEMSDEIDSTLADS